MIVILYVYFYFLFPVLFRHADWWKTYDVITADIPPRPVTPHTVRSSQSLAYKCNSPVNFAVGVAPIVSQIVPVAFRGYIGFMFNYYQY